VFVFELGSSFQQQQHADGRLIVDRNATLGRSQTAATCRSEQANGPKLKLSG
jgi:hypothetical protein